MTRPVSVSSIGQGCVFRGMNRMKTALSAIFASAKTVYVCPMHPEVVSDTPGICPKCNMKLDPKTQVHEGPDAA